MIGLVAMTLRVVCCAVVSLALFVSSVAAGQSGPPQDPRVAQPERPTVATHAHTVAPGFFELETGLQGSHPVTGVIQIDTPSLLKIGVTSRLQLDLFGGMSAFRQPGRRGVRRPYLEPRRPSGQRVEDRRVAVQPGEVGLDGDGGEPLNERGPHLPEVGKLALANPLARGQEPCVQIPAAVVVADQ
ncbi:MAG: hypothetical protein IMZ55_03725, partial [Acidobacteria bacterium]|nr:hypothetical protein [Acidobacteriota bacterium]